MMLLVDINGNLSYIMEYMNRIIIQWRALHAGKLGMSLH